MSTRHEAPDLLARARGRLDAVLRCAGLEMMPHLATWRSPYAGRVLWFDWLDHEASIHREPSGYVLWYCIAHRGRWIERTIRLT